MKTKITFILILGFSITLKSQIVQNGLQSYYNFNSNMITDLSENNLDGTGYNIESGIGLEDTLHSAYDYNGFSSYIDLGIENRNITNQLTLSAWIKTNSNERQMILAKYNWMIDKGYVLAVTGGKASLEGRDNNGGSIKEVFSDSDINDGEWHHVLGIIDDNKWSIYINCEKENEITTQSINPTFSTDIPLTTGYLTIPGTGGNQYYFEGTIDEVRVYNRPLSQLEIDSICNINYIITHQSVVKGNSVYLIYPNPSKDYISVIQPEATKIIDLNFEIYNINGKLIKKGIINNQIDLNGLENGLYFLKIKDRDKLLIGNELIIKH